MDDTPLKQAAPAMPQASMGLSSIQIGRVSAVTGFTLTCILFDRAVAAVTSQPYSKIQIGALIRIPTPTTVAFGFINGLALRHETVDKQEREFAVADVELLGELLPRGAGAPPLFARGIS